MRNISILTLAIILFAACGESKDDLASKKEELTALEAQVTETQSKIAILKKEIESLGGKTKEEKSINVTALAPVQKDFQKFIEIQGTIDSKDNIYVTSDIGGIITKSFVKEGQNVTRGQQLYKLDDAVIQSNIQEIESGLSLATQVYEKRANLWAQNIGSEIEYLQAKNNKENLEKTLATVKTQLAKTIVRAPLTGIIDQVLKVEGELASPGLPLARVINLNKVQAVADVPETFLPSIKKGQKVILDIPALNIQKEAKINMVGQTINAANRTFRIESDLRNTDKSLKPNLITMFRVVSFEAPKSIVIPSKLVLYEDGKDYVFVIQKEGKKDVAKKTLVTLGETYNGEVIVKEGLTTESFIVNDGFNIVTNDVKVNVKEN